MKTELAVKAIGANGKRHNDDFYPTPPECTEALLRFLNLPKGTVVWEPACGEMHICDVLARHGYPVVCTDIRSHVDFLTADMPEKVEWIITNPPFSLSEQFIYRAAAHEIPFAYLLKSQYFHAAKRKPLFDTLRPTHILPLTWRPDFTGEGASLMDMIWVVWAHKRAETTIYQPLERPKAIAEANGTPQTALW